MQNLTNESLFNNIITNQIPCKIIAKIDIFEKQPEKWAEIKQNLTEKESESLAKMQFTSDKTCGKCKNRTVIYHSVQTRSADEPETQNYSCLTCNNSWKVSM
jgi:DNA-directed RNA polymerase subunit M/transcription elongation factor TFIIS